MRSGRAERSSLLSEPPSQPPNHGHPPFLFFRQTYARHLVTRVCPDRSTWHDWDPCLGKIADVKRVRAALWSCERDHPEFGDTLILSSSSGKQLLGAARFKVLYCIVYTNKPVLEIQLKRSKQTVGRSARALQTGMPVLVSQKSDIHFQFIGHNHTSICIGFRTHPRLFSPIGARPSSRRCPCTVRP